MAIKTSIFGGVTLTGKAAKEFQEQFIENEALPNIVAKMALAAGRRLLKEYKKKGFISVKFASSISNK